MNVYPTEQSWLVQLRLNTGEWGTTLPTDDKNKAYARMERGRAEDPEREYRIVKATTVYTQEHPDPAAEDEYIGIEEVLAFIAAETERQRTFVEQIEHMTDNVSADHEDDSK